MTPTDTLLKDTSLLNLFVLSTDPCGFSTKKRLRVSNSSVVSLENVTAGSHGGAFTALGDVEIAGHSTVNISNSQAESGDGGGFDTEKGLKLSTGSRLIIWNATA